MLEEYGPSTVYGEFHAVCHDLIVRESGLTSSMLEEHVAEAAPKLRPGARVFIEMLRESGIPLLITSAGIADIIAMTLERHEIDLSHREELLYIDANSLQFDGDGRLTAILPEEPVHSQSKHLASQRLPSLFYSTSQQATTHWDAALVMGDRPGDFEVLKHHPEVVALKIGFARDEASAKELVGAAGCHIVLIGENDGFEPLLHLLDVLIQAREDGLRAST
jgi:phosphoserine phosphatase